MPRALPPFDPALATAYPVAIGCDEGGRGALCGPVVVAAVWFDPAALPPALLAALDDRSLLGAANRHRLRAMDPADVQSVLIYASRASAITASRPGADPPTREELAD